MCRFGLTVLAATLISACSSGEPSLEQVRADHARISPGCASFSIDKLEHLDQSVWATVTTKCPGSNGDRMQLQYKRQGGRWAMVWYAPVLDD